MGGHTGHDLYEAYPTINGQLHAEMLFPSRHVAPVLHAQKVHEHDVHLNDCMNMCAGGTGVWLDSPAIMGLLGAPATVYGSLSPDRQSAQNQSCIGRSYTAALYCQPCDSGSHAQPAFSGLVLTS